MKETRGTNARNVGSDFILTHFPSCRSRDWNDWKWQVSNQIRRSDQLEHMIPLPSDNQRMMADDQGRMPMAITPYYTGLLCQLGSDHPLWRTVLPTPSETLVAPGEHHDSLGEDTNEPIPGLIHTYPDKVLLLVTQTCATYCRYCTRSRRAGGDLNEKYRAVDMDKAVSYINQHKEIRDVLISGGDPLMLDDDLLQRILEQISAIPHVEFIRLGTKIPVVLPQRITKNLVEILARYHPLWITLHFTHPDEITLEVEAACNRLADVGIPMGNQTVLLAGINDDLETMKKLMHKLLRIRVRPYYLHQCDAVAGTSHFRTPVETGMDIIRGLHGHTTGYAVPTYMVDAPGGGGKVPLMPNYIQSREGNKWTLQNYQGETYTYHE